jgi:ribokinase
MDKAPIAVVGSANMDLTFRTARLPQPGETLAGHAFHTGFGGKGANQAVMAARLGAAVSMIARVGNDLFGKDLLRNFQAQGVDTAHVRVDPERESGVAAIVVDETARNCILVIPGANHGLTPADVRTAEPVLVRAHVVLAQLEVPVEATLEAFRIARQAGALTILNPAPAGELPAELLQLTAICAPNETEIERLTGWAVSSLEQASVAARRLRETGPEWVILTLGERGVLVAGPESVSHLPAVRVAAVDPTGAGDALLGSLAAYLAEGVALPEAVRRASAVAALSVTRPGAQAAFPDRAEASAFWERHGQQAAYTALP